MGRDDRSRRAATVFVVGLGAALLGVSCSSAERVGPLDASAFAADFTIGLPIEVGGDLTFGGPMALS